MKRWQIISLALLILVPAAICLVVSIVALGKLGWLPYIFWLLPVFWSGAYLLARRWRQDWSEPPPLAAAPHWTARDEAAWKLVESTVGTAPSAGPEQFLDPHFYLQAAQQLARDLATHYHGPGATDPLGPLTVPEVLAAAELALHDSGDWLRRYVPGSHLLRIDHWRLVARAPQWATWASRLWRAGSLIVDPTSFLRQLAASFTIDSTTRELTAGLLQAFYCVFLQRVGYYLIELNSGRLKLGADRYRQQLGNFPTATSDRQFNSQPAASAADDAATATGAPSAAGKTDEPLVIAVVGQVSAGKSSVINAVLGEQRAAADILPTTQQVQRYRLVLPHSPQPLELLDTPGYGEEAADDQALLPLAQHCDLVLIVMNASHPARDLDVRFVTRWREFWQSQPQRKPPPLIGVLTHIDSLRPVAEWSPPYQLAAPYQLASHPAVPDERPKAAAIRAALDYNAALFQPPLAALVPVFTAPEAVAVYGIDEYLLPAMLRQLPESRAAALLRLLHQEWEETRITRTLTQIKNAAAALLQRS
ncbi:MAG: GTPase family protein [Planctomycetota bacterium]